MAVANPERGEVALKVHRNGEDKEYVLKLSINAAVAMQQKLKKPLADIVNELQKMDASVLRELAFMFLQKHHKDEIKTVDLAGDIIDDAGGIAPFINAFQQLVQTNATEASGGAEPNPQKAQMETTSGSSTSQPDATV